MKIIDKINRMLAEMPPILKMKKKFNIGEIQPVELKSCSDCRHGHYKCMPFGGGDYISGYYSCDVRKMAVEPLEANHCVEFVRKASEQQNPKLDEE